MLTQTPTVAGALALATGTAKTDPIVARTGERRILPLLKNREVVRLLTVLLENPGTYRAVIAEKMGVTPTTVNWHLKRLVAVGLITETRQGRSAYLNVDREKLAGVVEPLVTKLEGAETDTAEVARQLLAATDARRLAAPSPIAA